MDKHTLSHYGWIIVMILCLSVLLALATPLGHFVGDGVVSIANGFVGTASNSVDEDNITKLENQWTDKLNNYSKLNTPTISISSNKLNITPVENAQNYVINIDGTDKITTNATTILLTNHISDTNTHQIFVYATANKFKKSDNSDTVQYQFKELHQSMNDTIPSGGKYISKLTNPATTYTNGQFPERTIEGDQFYYGHYWYIYDEANYGGWQVLVYSGAPADVPFPNFLKEINGKLVTSSAYTFQSDGTEENPIVFTDDFTIPETVNYVHHMFQSTKMNSLPEGFEIPEHITDINNMFYNSTIKVLPSTFKIPSGVTDMSYAFNFCERLSSLPEGFTLPKTELNAYGAFASSGLITLPKSFYIPKEVKVAYGMFQWCDSLTVLPETFYVEEGVGNISALFYGCSSLTGTVRIDTMHHDGLQQKIGHSSIFTNTVLPIKLVGTAPVLSFYAQSANNGNVTYEQLDGGNWKTADASTKLSNTSSYDEYTFDITMRSSDPNCKGFIIYEEGAPIIYWCSSGTKYFDVNDTFKNGQHTIQIVAIGNNVQFSDPVTISFNVLYSKLS